MKTLEFKLNLTKHQEQDCQRWAEVLKIVWNRAIALLEWRQYYLRLQKCLETPDPQGIFDIKPTAIFCYKKNEDYILYSPIAADFRIDKKLGWEIKENVELRQVINLVKPHWQSEPLLKGYGAINIRKPFAQIRYPWIKEQGIPMLLVNDYLGLVVAESWKLYQQGKLNRPKYKKYRDKIKTIPSASFRKHCKINRETQRIRLPGMSWLKIKDLNKRIPEDADISTFKICLRPSGYYLQLGWNNHPQRKGRKRKVTGTMQLTSEGYSDKVVTQPIPELDPRLQRQVKREQEKLSRCEYNSNRWHKQRKKVARINEKISKNREGWQHWHTSKISDIYEDLLLDKSKAPSITDRPDPFLNPDGVTYDPNGAQRVKDKNRCTTSLALSSFSIKLKDKFSADQSIVIYSPSSSDESETPQVQQNLEKPIANKSKTKTRSQIKKRKLNRRKKSSQERLEPNSSKTM